MFDVYVLISASTGKIYIGQSINSEIRLKQHNDPSIKVGRYTKINRGPWKLIYKEGYNTRAEALKREKQLKSYRGREFIKTKILGR